MRKSGKQGAGFLINLRKDGDFEYDIMRATKLAETRVGAVENRRDVAVACNKGYSGHISRSGRILEKVTDEKGRCIPVTLTIYQGTSSYARYGDWLPLLALLFLIASILYPLLQNRSKK